MAPPLRLERLEPPVQVDERLEVVQGLPERPFGHPCHVDRAAVGPNGRAEPLLRGELPQQLEGPSPFGHHFVGEEGDVGLRAVRSHVAGLVPFGESRLVLPQCLFDAPPKNPLHAQEVVHVLMSRPAAIRLVVLVGLDERGGPVEPFDAELEPGHQRGVGNAGGGAHAEPPGARARPLGHSPMAACHQRTTVGHRMAIPPTGLGARGLEHVPLPEAGRAASFVRGDGVRPGIARPDPRPAFPRSDLRSAPRIERQPLPARPAVSNRDRWDELLNRLGEKYNVPPIFLKAVMLAESGGDPYAIGDDGHSVGLFQLHDQGYGYGMGDLRFDPEANADRAARGLAEAWRACVAAGYTGEYLVRAAYDYSFNPGGGFSWQGDRVVAYMNELLAEAGLPPLS